MKTNRLLTILVLLIALTATAFAADKKLTDDYISDSVREKLAGDSVVKGGAIDVDVKAGVVTLSGRVQDSKQKNKAESLTKKVKGVKSVVDNIRIVPQ